MSVRLREPWDHPWEGPFLSAWGGHYDHAFVSLHPFYRDRQAPWNDAVGWAEVARACGSPTFAEFARALWDASYYRTDADPALVSRIGEVIDRLDLIPPADSSLNESLLPAFCRMFRALGLETARVRDGLRNTEDEVTLAAVEADPWAVHTSRCPHASAMYDCAFRLIVTTQASSDWQWSVVGLKSEALDFVGGELPVEGFWAGPKTGPLWIDEPGTYSYPDWLSEAPDAA